MLTDVDCCIAKANWRAGPAPLATAGPAAAGAALDLDRCMHPQQLVSAAATAPPAASGCLRFWPLVGAEGCCWICRQRGCCWRCFCWGRCCTGACGNASALPSSQLGDLRCGRAGPSVCDAPACSTVPMALPSWCACGCSGEAAAPGGCWCGCSGGGGCCSFPVGAAGCSLRKPAAAAGAPPVGCRGLSMRLM